MFLDSGMWFGFWEVFWILGSVLDSGKCCGFWEVFLDSGTCFVHTSHGKIDVI